MKQKFKFTSLQQPHFTCAIATSLLPNWMLQIKNMFIFMESLLDSARLEQGKNFLNDKSTYIRIRLSYTSFASISRDVWSQAIDPWPTY